MTKITKIILFDGVCNLCNGFVQFVIKHDARQIFKFASLQSDFGQNFLKNNGLNAQKFDSVILIQDDEFYTESTAGLKILSELKGYRFTRFFLHFPTTIRDFVYQCIAKNRYRWFGKSDTCWMPTPELKKRFL